MKPIRLISMLCLMSFSFACTNDNIEDLYPEDECADFPTEDLTYNSTMKALLDTHCGNTSCHVENSPQGITDYTNYANLKDALDDGRFQQRVLIDKNMPPSQSLSLCELNQIEAWVNDGYPEN